MFYLAQELAMKLPIEFAARARTESAEQSQLPVFWKSARNFTSRTQDHWDCLLVSKFNRGETVWYAKLATGWSLLCSRPWNGKSMLETGFCGLFLQKSARVFV